MSKEVSASQIKNELRRMAEWMTAHKSEHQEQLTYLRYLQQQKEMPEREMFVNPLTSLRNPMKHLIKRPQQSNADIQAAKRQKTAENDDIATPGTPSTPPCDNLPEPSENPIINKDDYIIPEKTVLKATNQVLDIENIVTEEKSTKRALKRQDAFCKEESDREGSFGKKVKSSQQKLEKF